MDEDRKAYERGVVKVEQASLFKD